MRENFIPAEKVVGLSEKDKELNALARELDVIARGFAADAVFTIKMADSETPENHAEVDTESLANLKRRVMLAQELIYKIESAAGIIDAKTENGSLSNKN